MRKVWLVLKEGAEKLWSVLGKPLLAFATLIPIILLFIYVYDTFKKVSALEAEVQALTKAVETAGTEVDGLKNDLEETDHCREKLFELAESFGQHIKALEEKPKTSSGIPDQVKDRWSLFELGAKVFIARCQCYGGDVHFGKLRCDGDLSRKPATFDPQYKPD